MKHKKIETDGHCNSMTDQVSENTYLFLVKLFQTSCPYIYTQKLKYLHTTLFKKFCQFNDHMPMKKNNISFSWE